MPSGTFFIDSFSFFTDVDCCIHKMCIRDSDNFGRSLLSIRRILERKENQDKMDEQLSALKHLVYILTDSSVENIAIIYYDVNFRSTHKNEAIKLLPVILENFEYADICLLYTSIVLFRSDH